MSFPPMPTRRSRPSWIRIAVLIVVSLFSASFACAAESENTEATWPQFLGPQRNGISVETRLISEWPADGPKEVWRAKGGVGMSGMSISSGQLLTLVQDSESQFVVALDAGSGKQLWRTAIAKAYRNRMGNGPRATPTIAGDVAVALSGEGVLAVLNRKDGKRLWARDVVKEFRGKPADYGMACSPLVVGDRVVVMAGGRDATAACYEISTGKLAWKSGEDPGGYSSPALLRVGGLEQIVMFTGNSLIGMKPDDGSVFWRYPFETDFYCNTATPISVDGNVLISAGENHGSVMLSLTPTGSKFDVGERWTQLGVKSTLRSEWQTPIALGGYVYGMDNVGSAGQITHLTCVDAKTGERVWTQRRFGKGNLIAAEGKLFISTMKGELVVVRATSAGYDEIGRQVVIGETRQAPSLAGGLIYLRDDKEVVCLDVRKP